MENLNTSPNDNPAASEWDKLKEEPSKVNDLPLFTEVYGDYKISSMPFDTKDEAYEEINQSWQGVPDVTTYFDQNSKKWYVISK